MEVVVSVDEEWKSEPQIHVVEIRQVEVSQHLLRQLPNKVGTQARLQWLSPIGKWLRKRQGLYDQPDPYDVLGGVQDIERRHSYPFDDLRAQFDLVKDVVRIQMPYHHLNSVDQYERHRQEVLKHKGWSGQAHLR